MKGYGGPIQSHLRRNSFCVVTRLQQCIMSLMCCHSTMAIFKNSNCIVNILDIYKLYTVVRICWYTIHFHSKWGDVLFLAKCSHSNSICLYKMKCACHILQTHIAFWLQTKSVQENVYHDRIFKTKLSFSSYIVCNHAYITWSVTNCNNAHVLALLTHTCVAILLYKKWIAS